MWLTRQCPLNDLGVTSNVIDEYLPNLACWDLLCQSQGQGNPNEDPSPLWKLNANFSRLIERAINLDKIVGETNLIKNQELPY